MSPKQKLNRRDFIKRSAVGTSAATLALNTHLIANAQSTAANSRVNVGFIGVGARAQQIIEDCKNVPGLEIVAMCDAYKVVWNVRWNAREIARRFIRITKNCSRTKTLTPCSS
jgi:predicted homoserine dehydrogenase-like protein